MVKRVEARTTGDHVTLKVDGRYFRLDEQDARDLRAEINRCIERLVTERRAKDRKVLSGRQ